MAAANQQQVMHRRVRPAPVTDIRRLLSAHFAQHTAQAVLAARERHGPPADKKLALAQYCGLRQAPPDSLANKWL